MARRPSRRVWFLHAPKHAAQPRPVERPEIVHVDDRLDGFHVIGAPRRIAFQRINQLEGIESVAATGLGAHSGTQRPETGIGAMGVQILRVLGGVEKPDPA